MVKTHNKKMLEMQIKTTVRYHLTLGKMAIIKRSDSKRDTDVKNRLLDSVGEREGGMEREDEHDIYLSGGPATSCIDQKMEQVQLTSEYP